MPRRRAPLCSKRDKTRELSALTWSILAWGHAWGLLTMSDREIADAWREWRPLIAPRWRVVWPGSRAAAAYLTGELQAPPARTKQGGLGELEHLLAIGAVGADEERLARIRIDHDPYQSPHDFFVDGIVRGDFDGTPIPTREIGLSPV